MRVGIIGAGNMGSAFARRLSAAGHEVSIASRDVEDARAEVAELEAQIVAARRQFTNPAPGTPKLSIATLAIIEADATARIDAARRQSDAGGGEQRVRRRGSARSRPAPADEVRGE